MPPTSEALNVPAPVPELSVVPGAPHLTQARSGLLREIVILDEYGERRPILIPVERPLTVFVDKRELVTLMDLTVIAGEAVAGTIEPVGEPMPPTAQPRR